MKPETYKYIDLTPKLKLKGKEVMVDIRSIANIFREEEHHVPLTRKESYPEKILILSQLDEKRFDCIGDPKYCQWFIKHYEPSHLTCFVLESENYSENELQNITDLALYLLPCFGNSKACEIFIEKFYISLSFRTLIEEHFRSPGKTFTDQNLLDLLFSWGHEIATLNRRKKKYGATKAQAKKPLSNSVTQDKPAVTDQPATSSMLKKASSDEPEQQEQPTEVLVHKTDIHDSQMRVCLSETWNSFSFHKEGPNYEDVQQILKSEVNIEMFKGLVASGELEQAWDRLEKFVAQKRDMGASQNG